ncbi:MAG TPA: intradiol ring-cleavage dioxygenase [Burkholderiales bacterium]|nr:intradiol ring-cleavage dioxygenase [Burkholderiales bacterium]
MISDSSRRRLLGAALLWPVYSLAQSCGKPTPRQTEGPFFKPQSPERNVLVQGNAATLLVTGRVLGPDCKPVAHALLDFWHADEKGEYDNSGFHYRGHQFSDADGRYRLETIVPAEYPGRARHIHVKLQPPGGRLLTTQLYFPNQERNEADDLFRPELAMQMTTRSVGRFDFVLG